MKRKARFTVLRRDQLDSEIVAFVKQVQGISIPPLPQRPLALFRFLKREPVKHGDAELSMFEVANRVMSDLIVFLAARRLLNNESGILGDDSLTEVRACFGTEQGLKTDLEATTARKRILRGECFNVAWSFFPTKYSRSRKKLADLDSHFRVIAFNLEAARARELQSPGLLHLAIDVEKDLIDLGVGEVFAHGLSGSP